MILRLTYVHQLKTFYLCYGVKCQSGVIWGHDGHEVTFSKNAITCYPAGAAAGYCFLLVSASFFILPAQPQDLVSYSFLLSSYPAGAAAGSCFLLVSSYPAGDSGRVLFLSRFFFLSFFLLSFFFLATRLFHILPYIRF